MKIPFPQNVRAIIADKP
nr:hypothetical protein [Sicyoidochytrium minutum DNA virus]